MSFKSFEYRRRDLKMLNKDSTIRMVFVVLMSAVLIWQIAALVPAVREKTLNAGQLVSVCVVAFICIITAFYSIISIIQNARSNG